MKYRSSGERNSHCKFFLKKPRSAPSTISVLMSHEDFGILVLKVS